MSTRSDEAVFTGSALPDTDTSVELSFGLDVDDVFSSRISEVTCLETERDVGERKTKGPAGRVTVRNSPVFGIPPEVTLTRRLSGEPASRGDPA